MDYSAYKHMKIERNGKILTIMLNRPPMNPIHYELHNELARLWHQVQLDHDSDVIIFTGAGDVFSAGGDIPMMQKRIDNPELFNQKNLEMKQMIFGLLDLEKPVIARINGDCIGLGATLALLCDITIAVDDARFGDPHDAQSGSVRDHLVEQMTLTIADPGDRLIIMHGISSRVLRGVMTGLPDHPEWRAPIADGLPQGSLVMIEGGVETLVHRGTGHAPA